MGNMTLGKKISLGFGLIILIALVLGLLGVFNMKSAENNSERLAKEYAPEVAIVNGIEKNFLRTRLNMVAYLFNGSEASVSEAKKRFKRAMERLEEAKAHVVKYPNLVVLAEQVKVAETELNNYWEAILDIEKAFAEKAKVNREMDRSAGEFVKNVDELIYGQYAQMEADIAAYKTQEKLQERLKKIELATSISELGAGARINNFKSAARRDNQFVKNSMKNFDEMDQAINEILKVTYRDVDKERLETVRTAANSYKKAINEMFAVQEKMEQIDQRFKAAGIAALKAAEDAARAGVAGTEKLSVESYEALSASSLVMIIGLIMAVVIGIALAFYIIRSIVKPMTSVVQMLTEANSQVVSAAEQISSSSQSLAEGASEQAGSVEQISATIEQSTSINNQNNENSREADMLAKATNESAMTGNEKIQQLSKAMDKITESSERIAKIIKTIDEIAFQTNLLALNAAVEAARAGEHGLGFAVVADEVKNLAQRSADAAKETANIIEEAIEEIKGGNQIAKATNESFVEILDKAKKTSDLIGEISISIKEQTEGMNQISSAMGQVDQITQQNAANSEETVAAAEQLNAQAQSMMTSVHEVSKQVGYKVDGEEETAHLSHHSGYTKPSHGGASKKSSAQKKPMSIAHQPKKATKSQPAQRSSREDDVFPLDEDDMKEF